VRIRTRLFLWFGGVMSAALLAMGLLSYWEFVVEPRRAQLRPAGPKTEEAEENTLADLGELLLWCGLPALALALGGGWWLTRKATEPVAALTRAAERVNEHNLREQLSRTGNGDELDRLTEVFNHMTERLDDSFQRIREFTLHASHELKTPLTVLHGELETWLGQENLATPDRQRLESELDEVQRLTTIVDGLTLLTKAGAGLVRLAREPVPLDELVREAAGDAQSLARPRRVTVQLGTCDPIAVLGDRHRLRQLLLNLCDNAVKYAEEGGQVNLELLPANGAVEVVISNTGPGITPAVLARVFEPFFRGDASHSQRIEGCGLGLSIARWIAEAHQGTLVVHSEPGKLTTARARLPVASSGAVGP